MTRLRYDHILAGTALALILAAIPAGSLAQNADKAAPLPAAAAEQQATEAPVANPTLAAPTVAIDPLASLDPADRPFAEKIRDFFAASSDRIFTNKKERAAAEAFYQSRNYAPLWLDKGIENARAISAIARLKNADADGLESSDYKIPTFAGLAPEALAEADLKLTQTVLTYARHVQAGRFPYTRVSRNIELPQAAPETADVLNAVAATQDASKVLDAFSPQHEEYRKLKAMLAELRGAAGAKKGDASRQIETILANMERWRWYPRDLGSAHVIVNQPDFTLRVMHDGAQVWTTRIVIGKPSMPTPLLSETMKYITVNPTWHVPPSIVHNEYLPALAQDPTVLSRMGLRVSYSGGGVSISQPPGPGNALGRIRFNFPNRFLVYQHDTPDKYYFAHEVRAYSHGCMRVQDPAKYAEVLLNIVHPEEHWTAARITRMFGTAEQNLQLQPTPVWVHLTYQTAFVDSTGKLQMRRDIYNLDSRTLAAMKSGRGGFESTPERKREHELIASNQRRSAPPAPVAQPARSGSFFQSMFSPPAAYGRPAVYR
ncbi:MAG TPA: L,D-transpeptidase family protein [Xanthobacteraceae bacterium]|jgi:murein L,D-transpeptidase YcbB/YkuD|nr:L,D-transpeptidase family protein [Xanthobacteraceae bacterium]